MAAWMQWPASLEVARRFWPRVWTERASLARIGALSLGAVACDLLRPWPIQWIVDRALAPIGEAPEAPGKVILIGAGAAALIAACKAGLQYAREIGIGTTELGITRHLRHELFRHLSILSPRFHAEHKSGDLLVRLMGDVPIVSGMLVSSTIELVTKAVFVVGIVAVMLVMDPLLTLATFVAAPVVLLIVRSLSRRMHVAVGKQRRKEGDLADYLHEAIAATETIQSVGGSHEVVRRFARNNRRSARAGIKTKRLAAGLSASVETILGGALAAVVALGSFRVIEGHLTTGELLVFISYVRTVSKPIRSASRHASKVAKGTACGERLLAILGERPGVEERSDARDAPAEPREITYEDVAFAYADEPVLHGFSATFRRGELSALVGRSGAGKSTVASLAQRLMDPTAGVVSLDGVPLTEMRVDSVRETVGLCVQRTMLFGESIRENLLLGAPEAEEPELWAALEQAGVAEVVAGLPDGLDTKLGSGGAGLSGGEASRLSIARTLLRKAKVVVVDEPFAGLDRAAALRIDATLRELAQQAIVIAIAHDFENIERYDHVVFVDGGQAVAAGRHDELLSDSSRYREIVRSRSEVLA